MTRPTIEHEGLNYGPRIKLSGFTALRFLRIFHVFLEGTDEPETVWMGLPPNLETLEVFYDDRECYPFFGRDDDPDNDPAWYGGRWLRELLRRRRAHFPKLRSIKVFTIEDAPRPWGEDYDFRLQRDMDTWTLPGSLKTLCEEADADVTVWVNTRDGKLPDDYDALDVL
jgi:hypothetical protein